MDNMPLQFRDSFVACHYVRLAFPDADYCTGHFLLNPLKRYSSFLATINRLVCWSDMPVTRTVYIPASKCFCNFAQLFSLRSFTALQPVSSRQVNIYARLR